MGRCELTVEMDFMASIPASRASRALTMDVPSTLQKRERRVTGMTAIWDDLPAQPGRKTDRPWGATREAWDAARKRFERRVYVHQARAPQEIRRRMIGHLKGVCRDQRRGERVRPWTEPVVPPEPKEVPQMTRVEQLFQPADSTSPTMVRMITEGRMPGFEWDPTRGVIRVRMAVRVRPVESAT